MDFSPMDVARVVICTEDAIYGLNRYNTADDGIYPAEPYLKPSGATIRDKATIVRLHAALRSASVASGYPKTGSGILSYQVFLDGNDKVLAVTSIENYRCCVSMHDCSMKNGWIRFNKDMSSRGCQSVLYCRTIYEFMKQELPAEIERWDQFYRPHTGGIEQAIFGM